MAIPIYDPYRREQPNMLSAVKIGLDMQLARERMMVEDARAKQVAAQREREDERQHQQQMAQYGLNEMKANYEMQQNDPGGFKYERAMAQIGQYNSAADENNAQADYWQKRTENPAAFRNPPVSKSAASPKLTQPQLDQNASDYANKRPLTYPVSLPLTAGSATPDNSPILAAGPPGYDADLPTGQKAGAIDPWSVLDPIPPGTYDPAVEGGGANLMPAPSAPASNEPPMLDAPPAAPADALLPAPWLPRGDASSRIILDKEKEKRIAALNKQIASLTTSAAGAERAASEAESGRKETFQQSADLFAAQLQQHQQELRNIVDPPWSPTNARGPVDPEPLEPSRNASGQKTIVKPDEVPSLRERNKQNANAGINAQWDSFKNNTLAELPKLFSPEEGSVILKSIRNGEKDELAVELAARGSNLVEQGRETTVDNYATDGGGGGGSQSPLKPVFKRIKAPNGEMMSAFEVLKLAVGELSQEAKGSKVKPPSDKAKNLAESLEK